MKCPVCTRPIEPKTVLTCRRCWWLIPNPHRGQLASLHNRKLDTAAKLQLCVRLVREKHPELVPLVHHNVSGTPDQARVLLVDTGSRVIASEMMTRHHLEETKKILDAQSLPTSPPFGALGEDR